MFLRGLLIAAQLGCLGRCAFAAEPTPAPTQLLPPWASWRYLSLTVTGPPDGWEQPEFDDRSWASGRAGFSVGHFSYAQTATSLPMWTAGAAVKGLVLRSQFVLEDPQEPGAMFLRLEYEDGLRIWLNGVEVVRRGFVEGAPPAWDDVPMSHPPAASEVFDLTPHRAAWRAGTNVLALQVSDAQLGSATLYAWPELRRDFLRGPTVEEVLTRSAVVAWEVPAGLRTWLEWLPAEDSDAALHTSPAPGPVHALRMTGLTPGGRYRYQVAVDYGGGRIVRSAMAEFRPLRETGDTTFLVLGDSGSGSQHQYAVAALLQREAPDFVLHAGDIVYPGFTAGKADLRCLSVYEAQRRRIPWYFTLGNHDISGGDLSYRDLLWQPVNARTGSELFYSFDHGDVHVACLFVPWWGISRIGDVGADGSRDPQYHWLTNDLSTTSKPWKVVFFHQPPLTSGPHAYDDFNLDGLRDVLQMQAALVPLLGSLGVDVVFNGHDHNWERFPPVGGVHFVVTGGGGAVPYGVYQRARGSLRHVPIHHATRVRTSQDRMLVEAVDTNGGVFDQFVIGREIQPAPILESAWHEREEPDESDSNADGNRVGERFDLVGEDRVSVPGEWSNPGRLQVNVDRDFVRFGLRDVMLWPEQTVALWIGTSTKRGVSGLEGVGLAPRRHPVSALALRFEEFTPCLVALLGDEYADATLPAFGRDAGVPALGQGLFRLNVALEAVPSARVRQFNRSPESTPDIDEQNADFIVLSVPRSELGWPGPDDLLHVAAVVIAPSTNAPSVEQVLELDTASIAASFTIAAPGDAAVLRPVTVRMAPSPGDDEDADGLRRDEEVTWGTSPRDPDTDDDGLPDGWEVAHALNPVKALGDDGEAGDPDGDGYSNLEEMRSGTDPRDGRSTLTVAAARIATGALRLRWRAMVGRSYAIESATALTGPFQPLGLPGFPRRADSTNEIVVIELGIPEVAAPARWYRLRDVGFGP